MTIDFAVSVTLVRESGRFASRDECVEYLREQIEQVIADGVDGVGAEGDTVYNADDYSVEEVVRAKVKR